MIGAVIGSFVAAVVVLAVIVAFYNVTETLDARRQHTFHVLAECVNTHCRYCTVHSWERWQVGTCLCSRCRRISELEAELLPPTESPLEVVGQ